MSEHPKENACVREDREIIELYWRRDEKAIRETDRKYGAYLYTVAMNIVADRWDSEECVNDTWLATWNALPPEKPRYFKGYLAQLTRHLALDRYRQKTAAKRVPSQLTVSLEELSECMDSGLDTCDEVRLQEMMELLDTYLRTLPKRERQMFLCRYYFADPVGRIAEAVGLGESAVYKALTRMRNELRQMFEKEGYDV